MRTGAQLFSDVLDLNDKIKVQYLPSTPKILTRGGKLLFLIFGPLKVVFQIFSLFRLLLSIPQPSYILVQAAAQEFLINSRIHLPCPPT